MKSAIAKSRESKLVVSSGLWGGRWGLTTNGYGLNTNSSGGDNILKLFAVMVIQL